MSVCITLIISCTLVSLLSSQGEVMAQIVRPRRGKNIHWSVVFPGSFQRRWRTHHLRRTESSTLSEFRQEHLHSRNLNLAAGLTALRQPEGNTTIGRQLRCMADTILTINNQQIRGALEGYTNRRAVDLECWIGLKYIPQDLSRFDAVLQIS